MVGKRQVIIFLLLAALSSVLGVDLSFSRKSFDAVVTTERIFGMAFYDAEEIEFPNMDHEEEMEILYSFDTIPVLHLHPKGTPKTALKIHSEVENGNKEAMPLTYISFGFSKLTHPDESITTFGTLLICFKGHEEGASEWCLSTYMFTPSQTKEDQNLEDLIAAKVNPFTEKQVQSISIGLPFKWKLSSLKKILLNKIGKCGQSQDPRAKYALQPIIVDEKILEQCFDLFHLKDFMTELTAFDIN